MGKKNDSKSEAGSSKKDAAKAAKAASKAKEKKETKSKVKSETNAPAASSKPTALPTAARSVKSRPISLADIELRAYYVAEKRHREGRHGDAHSDWLEAERQLKQERKAKGSAGSATATKPKAAAKNPARKSVK